MDALDTRGGCDASFRLDTKIEEIMVQLIYGILLGMALMSIGSLTHATSKELPPMENCAGGPPCPWSPAPSPPPSQLPPRSCPGDVPDPAQPAPTPVPLPATVTVVEYQSDRGSYFYTIDAGEMNLLDTGEIPGWHRTGHAFAAYATPRPSLKPVFRFWMPDRGHMFTHDMAEVAGILYWHTAQWEGIAFFVSR